MRQLSRRRSSAHCGILPRRGFTCLGEDYIERVVCSGAPRGASTVAQLHPCGSSNCFRASLGLAIGKYVHNLLHSGLRQSCVCTANRFPRPCTAKCAIWRPCLYQGLALLHPLACSSLVDLASSAGLEYHGSFVWNQPTVPAHQQTCAHCCAPVRPFSVYYSRLSADFMCIVPPFTSSCAPSLLLHSFPHFPAHSHHAAAMHRHTPARLLRPASLSPLPPSLFVSLAALHAQILLHPLPACQPPPPTHISPPAPLAATRMRSSSRASWHSQRLGLSHCRECVNGGNQR